MEKISLNSSTMTIEEAFKYFLFAKTAQGLTKKTIQGYEDKDVLTETQKEFYKQSMAAFDGLTPTYHIGLMDDRPYLVWNFNSLIQGIQLMFSIMLTDENRPIRMCRNCGKAFIARRHRDKFCSKECSEEYRDHVQKL